MLMSSGKVGPALADATVAGPHASERIAYLDTLRATLMLLGVVIHAAYVYVSSRSWLVASSVTSEFFDYLTLIIHAFRMPAFFLLSGFLFALVLSRSATRPFMRSRFQRIVIPLVAVALVLNGAQLLAFGALGPEYGSSAINGNYCTSASAILAGCWKIHLWFLVVLLYFFIIGWPIVRLLNKLPLWPVAGPGSNYWILTIALMVTGGQAVSSLAGRGLFDFIFYLPFLSDRNFQYYLPFFCFGLLLNSCRENLAHWQRVNFAAVAMFVASWAVLLWWYDPSVSRASEFLRGGRYQLWLYYAVALQTSAFLVVLAARIPHPSQRFASYLSDTSYTVYLVHHLLVFAFALWLTNTQLAIGIQFLVAVVVVSILSWGFHHYVVARNRFFAFWLNGRT